MASVSRGDHVATLLTEARLLGSQAGSDGGAIWYVAATKAEHVIHASLFFFCGRCLIARVDRLWDCHCHCHDKGNGAVECEARSELSCLISSHDLPSRPVWLRYCSSCAKRNMTCQSGNRPELLKDMPASSFFRLSGPYGAGHLCGTTETISAVVAEHH